MKSKIKKVLVLGMPLERWTLESCTADFGVGDDFATVYSIESLEQGKGHASQLLTEAKKYYEKQGKKFGGTIAMNEGMRRIYKKLKIKEYA